MRCFDQVLISCNAVHMSLIDLSTNSIIAYNCMSRVHGVHDKFWVWLITLTSISTQEQFQSCRFDLREFTKESYVGLQEQLSTASIQVHEHVCLRTQPSYPASTPADTSVRSDSCPGHMYSCCQATLFNWIPGEGGQALHAIHKFL